MVVGASLLPIMNAFAKSLTGEFPLWQVTWARFTGHLLLMSLLLVPLHGWRVFRSANLPIQFARSVIFFASNLCFIAGLAWVSLAVSSSIMFTVPMIVTALSVIFLRERVGLWRWGAVALGFTGALVIVRPGGVDFQPATLLVLASAGCYSAYQLLTRRLTTQDSPQTQILWTALVGAVVTSAALPFVGRMPDTTMQGVSFLAIGCIGSVAHLLVIQALKRAPASIIAPIGYVELVGAATLGYFIFNDVPDTYTWLGAALIIGSGLVIAWREGLRGRMGQQRSTTAVNGIGMFSVGWLLVALALWLFLIAQ